jgi:hypothetical protein
VCWLDDHSRYVLHLSAHNRVTGRVVLASFRAAAAEHGIPASTLNSFKLCGFPDLKRC